MLIRPKINSVLIFLPSQLALSGGEEEAPTGGLWGRGADGRLRPVEPILRHGPGETDRDRRRRRRRRRRNFSRNFHQLGTGAKLHSKLSTSKEAEGEKLDNKNFYCASTMIVTNYVANISGFQMTELATTAMAQRPHTISLVHIRIRRYSKTSKNSELRT